VWSCFERCVASCPDHPALADHQGQLTYRDLHHQALVVGHWLRAGDHRFGNGVVPIHAPRGRDLVALMLGVAAASLAFVVIDPAQPASRNARILAALGNPPVVVTHREQRLSTRQVVLPDLSNGAGDAAAAAWPAAHPLAPAYLVQTSGSTGTPKLVTVSGGALCSELQAMRALFGATPQDRVLWVHAPSFDMSVEEVFLALTSGAMLVTADDVERQDIAGFAALINRTGTTVASMPTTVFAEWAAELARTGMPVSSSLRLLNIGGEEVQAADFQRFRQAAPHVRFLHTYGPSETGPTATAFDPDANTPCAAGGLPIGRPIHGVHAAVLAPDGLPARSGDTGELVIGGASVGLGYWGEPRLTAARFRPDPQARTPGQRRYHTGDLAVLAPDGNLSFRGRSDQQIKLNGFRIELGEIEAHARSIPSVQACAAAAIQSAGARCLVLLVVAPQAVPAAQIRLALQEVLPTYAVPSHVLFCSSIPYSVTGKTDRRSVEALASELLGARLQPPRPAPAADDDVHAVVHEVFAAILGRKVEDESKSFVKSGGTSLGAIRAARELSRRLNREVRGSLVLRSESFSQLCDHIRTLVVRVET
jgi:amino acid adenylation domain-containing protein